MNIECRTSIRALLMNELDEVLMIKLDNSSNGWVGWITPGGGKETGELDSETLKRELFEELGLKDYELIAPLWSRYHEYPWKGDLIKQDELIYLVRCRKFMPCPGLAPDDDEIAAILEYRWMNYIDIVKEPLPFAPRLFARHFENFLNNGIPESPFHINDNNEESRSSET